jgi:hypothetical protein
MSDVIGHPDARGGDERMGLPASLPNPTEGDARRGPAMVTDARHVETQQLAPLARADAIVAVHVEDYAGWCRGCQHEYGFAVPYPCTTRRWADRTHVITAHEQGANA